MRNWKTNYNKTAGCTQSEIDGFNKQLNPEEGSGHGKIVDVWRRECLACLGGTKGRVGVLTGMYVCPRCAELHPETVGVYSYYSYRFNAREKGIGWRLDSFLVSRIR